MPGPRPLPPLKGGIAFLYFVGGVLIPALCFFTAAALPDLGKPESKQDGWRGFFGLFFQREANWSLGLLVGAAAIALWAVLTDPKRYGKSVAVQVLIFGGIVVAATFLVVGSLSHHGKAFLASNAAALGLWFALAASARRRMAITLLAVMAFVLFVVVIAVVTRGYTLLPFLLVPLAGPACAFAAYLAMWSRIRAEARAERVLVGTFGDPAPEPSLFRPFLLWFAGYGVAVANALVQARRLYEALPDEVSGCYVATAAARGHPRLVRSWEVHGRRVNAQLFRLKAAELALARIAPRVHRAFRGAYDRVGPRLAARLRTPLAADLAYLSLKPLEWAVRVAFLAARAPSPPTARRSPAP